MKETMESQEVEPQKERSKEIHHLENWDGNPIAVMTDMEMVDVRSYPTEGGRSIISPIIKAMEIKNEKGEWNPYPSMIKKGDDLYFFTAENGQVFLDHHPASGKIKAIDEILIPDAKKAGIYVKEIE